MGELRPAKLAERIPNSQRFAELDASLEITLDQNRRFSGNWKGDVPALVMVTAVADVALSFADYAYLTIPAMTTLAVLGILRLSHNRNEKLKNPTESSDQPQGQAPSRAPPGSNRRSLGH